MTSDGAYGWAYAPSDSSSDDIRGPTGTTDEQRAEYRRITSRLRDKDLEYFYTHPQHFGGEYGERVKRGLLENNPVIVRDIAARIKEHIISDVRAYMEKFPERFQGEFGENVEKWIKNNNFEELKNLETHIDNTRKADARAYINSHPEKFQGKFGEDINSWLNSDNPQTISNVEQHIENLKAEEAKQEEKAEQTRKAEETRKAEAAGRAEEGRKIFNRKEYDRERRADDARSFAPGEAPDYIELGKKEAERLDNERVDRELNERLEESRRESLYSPHASNYWTGQNDLNHPPNQERLALDSPKDEKNTILQIRDLHRDIMDSGGDPTPEQADRLTSLYDRLTDNQQQYIADHLGFVSGEKTPEDERGEYGSHAEIDNSKGFSFGIDKDRLPSITKIEEWKNKDSHEISNTDFQELKNIEMGLHDSDTVDALKQLGYTDIDISSLRDQVRYDMESLNRPDVKARTEVSIPLKVGYKFNPDTQVGASFDVGVGTDGVNMGGRDKVFKLGFAHKFGAGAKNYGRALKTFGGTVGAAAKKLGATKLEEASQWASPRWEGAKNYGAEKLAAAKQFGEEQLIPDAQDLGNRFVEGVSHIGRSLSSGAKSGWESAKRYGSSYRDFLSKGGGLGEAKELGNRFIGGVSSGAKSAKESIQQMIANMYKSWYSRSREAEKIKQLSASVPVFDTLKTLDNTPQISRSASRSAPNNPPEPVTPTGYTEHPAPAAPNLHDQMIFEKDMQDVLKAIDPIAKSTRNYISRSSQNNNGSIGSNKLDQTRLEFLNMIVKEMDKNRKNTLKSWYNRNGWTPDYLPYLINRNYNKNFHSHVRGI
jgi:hypothetical protein